MKTPGGIVENLDGKLIVHTIRRVQTKDAFLRLCKIWQQGHMSAGDARNEPEKSLFGKSTRRGQSFVRPGLSKAASQRGRLRNVWFPSAFKEHCDNSGLELFDSSMIPGLFSDARRRIVGSDLPVERRPDAI